MGPSKIKCQTTGRPRTCPPVISPSQKVIIIRVVVGEGEGHVYFARSKMQSALRKNNLNLVFAIFMSEIKVPVDVLILVKLYRCGLKKIEVDLTNRNSRRRF